MQIKSLWVSKYKNIENLDLTFNSDLITLLVGKNGLGKSNLIEILALIFQALREFQKEEVLISWCSQNFEFDINFNCNGNEVNISVKDTAQSGALEERLTFKCSSRNSGSTKGKPLKNFLFKEFHRQKNDLLPKYVLGYYSGENKRIAEIIAQSERKIINDLKQNNIGSGFRSLFFTQSYHSQLLLLSLLVWNKGPHSKKFSELLTKYLKIDAIANVDIAFKSPDWNYGEIDKTKQNYVNTGVNFLFENKTAGMEFPFWGVKGKAHKFIDFLYENEEGLPAISDNWEDPARKNKSEYKEELIFLGLRLDELAKNVSKEFKQPLDLFDSVETCLHANVLESISINIRKKDSIDFTAFKELSEGEQQLLTVLSLLILINDFDCLLLLDEPDTHLNPEWQRNYVALLQEFSLNSNKNHIFLATHSPLLVQEIEEGSDVLLFKRNENNEIVIDQHDFKIKNWRIDQVFASEYFDFENTRPSALDNFMKQREELLSKPELNPEDLQQLDEIEDEVGVLPSGETINDIKAMQLIRSIVKEVND